MTIDTTTRNADLATLRDMLLHQKARKIDLVVRADKIKAVNGNLRIDGAEPIIEDDGVTDPNGLYAPTRVFDEGMASKLDIPLKYLRRMRDNRTDLYDSNVNGWLHGRKALVRQPAFAGSDQEFVTLREGIPGDKRKFMIRTFRGDDGGLGVARAILSSRYKTIDSFDILIAVMQGIRDSGQEVEVEGCDLSERRMYVRVSCPGVAVHADELLDGYRSPYTGALGAENPVVFAGFVFGNSEVGNGSFSITPRIIFQVCKNGMTITKDAMRSVHIGRDQDESVIEYSRDTETKELALITAQTRDAVQSFLSVPYLEKQVTDIGEKAGATLRSPVSDIEVVTKKLSFSDEVAAGVLDCFIKGGQFTAGGVMQAVTAYAQQVEDADLASSLEDDALKALDFAVALR